MALVPILDVSNFKVREAMKQLPWMGLTVRLKFREKRAIAIVETPGQNNDDRKIRENLSNDKRSNLK